MARTKANDSNVFKSKKGRFKLLPTDKVKEFDRRQSRVNRLETADDALGGDEDEFHRQRDSILFEHTRAGGRDKDDLGELSEDDEIYGLDLPSSEDEDEQEDEQDEEDEEDAAPKRKQFKKKVIDETPKGRFAKSAAADDSDEDGHGDSEDDEASDDDGEAKVEADSDNEDDVDRQATAEDSDDEETWAPGSYHASRRAPGEADSEDDEALELEEAEARRLQKKSKTFLAGEDFGMDDDQEDDDVQGERTRFEEEDEEPKQESVKKEDWAEEKAIAHLLKHNPETLALLEDLAKTAARVKVVEQALEEIRSGGEEAGEEHRALAIVELEHQALVTYLPTLTFYFSLLLSPHPSRELLDAVLMRLSSLRSALASMEELELTTQLDGSDDEEEDDEEEEEEEGMLLSDVWDQGGMQAVSGGDDDDDDDDDEDEDEEDDGQDEEMYDEDADMADLAEADQDFDSDEFDSDLEEERTRSMLEGLNDDDLVKLMAEMSGDRDADALIAKVKEVQAAKKAAQHSGRTSRRVTAVPAPPPTSKPKKERKSKKQVVIPELPALSASSSRKAASSSRASGADDYLDPTRLAHGDSTDKASARHSLRFHVSQVSQKERRRNEGHGRRIGGDDDLPRRSKENARREVLKRQQHGAPTSTGAALDDDDWGEADLKAAKAVRGSLGAAEEDGNHEPSGLDYYEQVKAETEQGRQMKKVKHDDERMAEKEELMSLAASSVDGPRGATRTILANKGLTPRRSKASRNSRVKKRLQYDKALKKVASMKAVYKGGDRSNYEGERSGIGKNTVKSVRLNK